MYRSLCRKIACIGLGLCVGLTMSVSNVLASGGAGEGPEGQVPGSPSFIGELTVEVVTPNPGEEDLAAEFNGRCGPVRETTLGPTFGQVLPGVTQKVTLEIPVPSAITVDDFQNSSVGAMTAALDGLVVDLSSILGNTPLFSCLDILETQPIFVIYPHAVSFKQKKGILNADVVMLNWVPDAP